MTYRWTPLGRPVSYALACLTSAACGIAETAARDGETALIVSIALLVGFAVTAFRTLPWSNAGLHFRRTAAAVGYDLTMYLRWLATWFWRGIPHKGLESEVG